jgi:protein-tyrosine kinase
VNLIEKAANRIAQTRAYSRATDVLPPVGADGASTLVDKAVSRVGDDKPVVKLARPAPPDEPQREAGGAPVSLRGSINLTRLKQVGMITPDGERTQLAEEFRQIKRPLLLNAFSQGAAPVKDGNLIMITSSLPGEGKTFCAVNLAMSIAMEVDRTVLLVDADVAKPSIPQYLGLKADKGLLDLLLDDSLQLSEVLIRTNVDRFTILPAGHGHRYATELLASTAMNRLLQDMARRYADRIIIFDSPPLLATSEARVLASHMGQIVMVIEAERTSHEAIKEALKHIESCEVVGMVLNKGKFLPGAEYYASYGYYAAHGK